MFQNFYIKFDMSERGYREEVAHLAAHAICKWWVKSHLGRAGGSHAVLAVSMPILP